MTFDPSVKSRVMLTMLDENSHSLGNIWRINAKKSDFYLEDAGPTSDTMHISVHGPQGEHGKPGFFLRVDKKKAAAARDNGYFVESYVPKKGIKFNGVEVAPNVFHIVRLRWTWDMQRPRFREYAYFGDAPAPGPAEQGFSQRVQLRPNFAWDVDLFVSYDQPYWPSAAFVNGAGDPRIGPLHNDAGHWLTGHSWVRHQTKHPTPAGIKARPPAPEETPNRMTCGGLGHGAPDDFYWFVESITSREAMENWDRERPNAPR